MNRVLAKNFTENFHKKLSICELARGAQFSDMSSSILQLLIKINTVMGFVKDKTPSSIPHKLEMKFFIFFSTKHEWNLIRQTIVIL